MLKFHQIYIKEYVNMVKKLITLLAFIHAVLYSANTAAEQTQSLSQPLVNQLIVCNSVINGGESACSMYDDSYIQALGNMLIGDTQIGNVSKTQMIRVAVRIRHPLCNPQQYL